MAEAVAVGQAALIGRREGAGLFWMPNREARPSLPATWLGDSL